MSQSVMRLATDRNTVIRFAWDRLWDSPGLLSSYPALQNVFSISTPQWEGPPPSVPR